MKNRIDIHSKRGMESRWDLSNPAHCRDFLKCVRVGPPPGSAITKLYDADKNELSIDEASDEQILGLVAELTNAMDGKKQ